MCWLWDCDFDLISGRIDLLRLHAQVIALNLSFAQPGFDWSSVLSSDYHCITEACASFVFFLILIRLLFEMSRICINSKMGELYMKGCAFVQLHFENPCSGTKPSLEVICIYDIWFPLNYSIWSLILNFLPPLWWNDYIYHCKFYYAPSL